MTGDLTFTPQRGRNRRWGGLLGLSFPLVLMSLALQVGFRGTGYAEAVDTAYLGAILFLIAAPTSWVFAIDFIEASRLTVLLVGAGTILPLWYLLGSRLALGSDTWRTWAARYASVCGLWIVLTFALIFVLDAFAG